MNTTRIVIGMPALLFAAQASAGIAFLDIVDPNVPTGFNAIEIVWTGGSDWTSAALRVDITSGSVYQHAFGTDAAPTAAFFPSFPDLEFDTYVGILGDATAGIAGGAGDLGGGPLSLDEPQISVSWFNANPDDTDPVRIGMLTLSADSNGTISILSGGEQIGGDFVGGSFLVPTPGEAWLSPTQPDVIPGYTAYEIFWNGNLEDWRNARFTLDLAQGSVYNHPAGGDLAPQSFQIAADPDLAYDTYLGIIDDRGNHLVPDACPGSCLPLDGPQLDVAWRNLGWDERGLVKIGNITLSNDAVGSWTLSSNGHYITGDIVPEPTTIAMIVLASPALIRRR